MGEKRGGSRRGSGQDEKLETCFPVGKTLRENQELEE